LFAGARGERWLFDTAGARLESAVPAPEDLVAILAGRSSGFWFVGKSGATYRSDEPLGRFVASTAPFEPLAEVAGSNRALYAVRRDRRLVQSPDAGASWKVVGPEGVSFVDVELDPAEDPVALSSPEALWKSTDGGGTWQRVEATTHGALGLEHDVATGNVRVLTVLGPMTLDAKGALAPVGAIAPEALPKGIRPLPGPNAAAVTDGRAAFAGPGYVEVRGVGGREQTWTLLSGPLKGPLSVRALDEARGCRAVRLAGYGPFLELACFRVSPELTQEIQRYASRDGGASFTRELPSFYAKLADFRMAVGANGVWLVTGACPPNNQAPGCAPAGILRLRPKARPMSEAGTTDAGAPVAKPSARLELAMAATPGLADSALALTFGADGKTAFAAARTTKGAGLAVFASTDGGASFEPREIGGRFDTSDEPAGRVSLSPGADGTVALVVVRGPVAALLVTDDQGRVISASAPPESSLVGAAGLSAVAVTGDGRVFESLDGGAEWDPAGNLPSPICDESGCDAPIACATAGCVVGDELTRVGWGSSDLPDLPALRTPGRVGRSIAPARLRTPIACALQPGPFRALPGADGLPAAENAALGEAAWFVLGHDAGTASATLYQARGGQRPRVEPVTLLAPVTDAARFAVSVSDQIEGGAALRYAVPTPRPSGARLLDVEVTWMNLLEKKLVRARVPDGGNYLPGDFVRLETGRAASAQVAVPELLSIAEHGLYLRLHSEVDKSGGTRQPTLFLDGKTIQTLPPIAFPPGLLAGGHDEMAHVGETHLGLYYVSPGPAVVRAAAGKSGWGFDAVTIGLSNPRAFGLEQTVSLAYLGDRMAFHVEWVDPVAQTAEARLFALRAEGAMVDPAVVVPTLRSFAERPTACSSAARESSPRIIGRALPGTRHPVIVSDPVDPPRAMLSGDAVLHGTQEAPCVAAFELETVRSSADRDVEERGIVLLDDLEHAWLLRRTLGQDSSGPRVEYRSMSCRFEPGLELPEELVGGDVSGGDADR
jgi:photosystem II stability/assembly factor-like uncharacterized protein